MLQIPVTQDPFQEQTFEFNSVKIRLTLRFNSIGNFWAMDVLSQFHKSKFAMEYR